MYLNNMQSYAFGSILILFLCFAACEKGILNGPLNPYGERVDLMTSESALFGPDANNGLKITVDQINDSRCPENATCIRAGEAAVKITIYDAKENSATFDLYFGGKSNFKPDTANFSINQSKFKAILYDVNPHPKTGELQDKAKAKITLVNN
ncbi:hypothetical protein I5M32_12915 [Pedobacter sp. SD-b]|uniref:DUF1735 domain-containing protein n=1 Tax=Pedobacter segetis TaxID=2793069 RepID=A0ABS1BM48_9SPHI|nr:hypothetical protein [Pedobacter segetis]MBK0383862.1 hypothetical protein [Pedobacter segetis]